MLPIAFDAMDELMEFTQDYLPATGYLHLKNLISSIQNGVLTYESSVSSDVFGENELYEFKLILNNSIVAEEANVNNNISLSSSEKTTILANFLLMKNLINTENFDTSIFNFVNNGGDENISLIVFKRFFASSWWGKVTKAVLYGVTIVAAGVVGYVIGSAIGGLPGGILGAAAGVSYAANWVEEWIGIELEEDISIFYGDKIISLKSI